MTKKQKYALLCQLERILVGPIIDRPHHFAPIGIPGGKWHITGSLYEGAVSRKAD